MDTAYDPMKEFHHFRKEALKQAAMGDHTGAFHDLDLALVHLSRALDPLKEEGKALEPPEKTSFVVTVKQQNFKREELVKVLAGFTYPYEEEPPKMHPAFFDVEEL